MSDLAFKRAARSARNDVNKFVRAAAVAAKRSGDGSIEFTISDIGDYVHVYGVNATGKGFVKFMTNRVKRRTTK